MVGTAQGDRAGGDERRSLRYRRYLRDRSARRHPVRGAIGRRRRKPDQHGDAAEFERAVAAFARSGNGGLIVPATGLAVFRRDLIVTLAAQHKLPAVYFQRQFVNAGGLISYMGRISSTSSLQAAGYVDRILNGLKLADLRVKAPTKYEWMIKHEDRQGA